MEGPWWPHQEGALKPLYHDSPLMDVQVVEGQGKMEVRELETRRGRRAIWDVVRVIYNRKYLQMLRISSRWRRRDNISMHDKAFNPTGHLWTKIKALCGEFSNSITCDLWWFLLYMKKTTDYSPFKYNGVNHNMCSSKFDTLCNSYSWHRKQNNIGCEYVA